MLNRIKKRGRPFEQIEYDESLYSYYEELNKRYTQWFEDYSESPKIQIDGDALDFVDDVSAREAVLAIIEEKLEEISDL